MALPLLAPFLAAFAAVSTQKILVSLGFGLIVFTGFQTLKYQFEAAIDASIGGMSADIYGIISLAGFVDVIGIWLGAWTVVGTMAITKRIGIL